MLQAYEGYLQRGQIYSLMPLINTQDCRRVIITVLDEPNKGDAQTNSPTWLDEFNRLLDESGDEKLHMEDFPRANFTREHLEVQP